jgi:hypothetical protein
MSADFSFWAVMAALVVVAIYILVSLVRKVIAIASGSERRAQEQQSAEETRQAAELKRREEQEAEDWRSWSASRGADLRAALEILERCHRQRAETPLLSKKPVDGEFPAAFTRVCDAYLQGDAGDCAQLRYACRRWWDLPYRDWARQRVAEIADPGLDRDQKELALRRGIAALAIHGVDFRSDEGIYGKLFEAATKAGLDPEPTFRQLADLIAPDPGLGLAFMTGLKQLA